MAQRSLLELRDQISLYLLTALFALLPITVVFGHRGLAPWLMIASIPAFLRGDFWLAAIGAVFDRLHMRDPIFIAFLCAVGFCFWIFLSGFWSPRAMPSLSLWVLAPVLVGASVVWFAANLNRDWSYRLGFGFAIAIGVGMVVLAFEGFSGGALRAILPPEDSSASRAKDIIALGRGVTALAPALFPVAIIAALLWNRWVGLAFVVVGLTAAIANDVFANFVALSFGLVCAVATFKAERLMIFLVVGGATALLVFAPLAMFIPVEAIFAAEPAVDGSTLHRLAIWQATAEKIPGGLPFGYGSDYARIWGQTAEQIVVPGVPELLSVMPNHPHNLFLQIWLELGVPGVIFTAGFLIFGTAAYLKLDVPRAVNAAAIGAFAAIFVSIMIEGSLWQVWRLAAMALAGMGVGLAFSLHKEWSKRR